MWLIKCQTARHYLSGYVMKPTTIASLQKCKQEKKRFATITAY
ncbi:hypothetical protein, partial [Escherichia coli]